MDAHVARSPGVLPPLPSVRLRFAADDRLAKLAGDGNEAAFAVLFQRFHQPLYRYCRSLLGNDADAQDALQTTFTQALVALREDRRTAPVRPWLYRIAHNESISLLRRRRPAQEIPEDGLLSPERSAAEIVEERSRLATLVADLQDLPERQRGALVMRELSGLPHEEIAEAFGISVGATKQTVLEARRSLQEFAEGRSMACEEIQRIVSDGDGRALRGRRVRAHLRECGTCRAFARAIPARRTELRALAPALPMATAAGLLSRITGSGHGGSGAGMAAGATTKVVALATSTKAVATGAAVVAAAALGAGEIHHLATSTAAPSRSAPAQTGDQAVGLAQTAGAAHTHGSQTRGVDLARTGPAHRAARSTASKPHPAAAARKRHHGRRHGVAAAGTAASAVVPAVTGHGHHGNPSPQTTGQGATHRAAAATAAHGPSNTAHGARGNSTSAPGRIARPAHTGAAAATPSRHRTATSRSSSHTRSTAAVRRKSSAAAAHRSVRAASVVSTGQSPHVATTLATPATPATPGTPATPAQSARPQS